MSKKLKVPHFQLSETEEHELVGEAQQRAVNLENYYRPMLNKIKRIQAARNCKNSENLLPILIAKENANEAKKGRPNFHMPVLISIVNQLKSSLMDGLLAPGFLQFKAATQEDSQYEEDVTVAFNHARRESRTDEKEPLIIEEVAWLGNCPTMITNEGRHNVIHEVLHIWEVKIPEELQEVFMGHTSVMIKEEYMDHEGDQFNIASVVTPDNKELLHQDIDDETGTALQKAEAYLDQFGVDYRNKTIVDEQIVSKEGWVDGLPTPVILDVLNTLVVPSVFNHNPDTYNWVHTTYVRTQDLIDNPSFINKNKFYDNDKLIGSMLLNQQDHEYTNYGNIQNSLKMSTPMVKMRMCYFDQYQFKNGYSNTGERRILRNFIVYTIEDRFIAGCQPCLNYTEVSGQKISKNPLIWFTYNKQRNNIVGTSPTFDCIDLSYAVNLLGNYMLDTLSRKGNKYVLNDAVTDFRTIQGGAGTIIHVNGMKARQMGIDDIRKAAMILPDTNEDMNGLFSTIAALKSEAQSVGSATHPFMQQKQKETATEVATLASQANVIVQSVINHLEKYFTEMYARQFDDLVQRSIKIESIPFYNNESKLLDRMGEFDFGMLKGKKFIPKMTTTNPELSKNVQVKVLTELTRMALESQDPEVRSRINISETVEEIMRLSGIMKPNLMRTDTEAQEERFRLDLKEQLLAAYESGQLIPAPVQPTATGPVQPV